jgi:hypothetical protein
MAVDEHGRVWIDGMTAATDLPTRNAFQSSYGGGYLDGFLAALSPDGSKLCYGTYVGGAGQDLLEGIAVGNGKVYASGISASKNLPQKNWRVQSGYGGGPFDAIVIGLTTPSDQACR